MIVLLTYRRFLLMRMVILIRSSIMEEGQNRQALPLWEMPVLPKRIG
jgi:hypothetical protein